MSEASTKNKKKKKEVRESFHEKKLGVLPLVKFKIVQGKKEIEPWKGKGAYIHEWLRHSSALLGIAREEDASYFAIEKDAEVQIEDAKVPDMKIDVALFASHKDGHHYNVAARLVPSNIQPGDSCRLHILGCCSIINVEKLP